MSLAWASNHFSVCSCECQGGHFDLADRMFHSVREAWFSASKHNMADVKELIPEFFYLPEFLLNSNNFDLGKYRETLAKARNDWPFHFSEFIISILVFCFVFFCLGLSGAKQNGTKLADVILPPWAKGDPREFIRVHREVRNKPNLAKGVSQWQWVDIWIVFHHGCRRWSVITSQLTFMNGLTSFLATSNRVHQL